MNFGSLQTVTAWRLTKTGDTTCQGIVLYGPAGYRLVVIENQQIVEWTCVPTASALRAHVRATVKKRCQEGWRVQHTRVPEDGMPPATRVRRSRRSPGRNALLTLAEQTT